MTKETKNNIPRYKHGQKSTHVATRRAPIFPCREKSPDIHDYGLNNIPTSSRGQTLLNRPYSVVTLKRFALEMVHLYIKQPKPQALYPDKSYTSLFKHFNASTRFTDPKRIIVYPCSVIFSFTSEQRLFTS